MNDQVNAFRALLETLDRVGAENAVNQALATLTPIQVIDRIVVPGEALQFDTIWDRKDLLLLLSKHS